MFKFFGFLITVVVVLSARLPAAELPIAVLTEIRPVGGNPGATLDVEVLGRDLDEIDALVFSDSRIVAEAIKGEPGPFNRPPKIKERFFRVTFPPDVPAGIYEVRAHGHFGVSNPRFFEVGRLERIAEAENNAGFEKAPLIALNRTVDGHINQPNDFDYFRFPASAGTRVLIDCCSSRLDSDLDGALVVLDAMGRELDFRQSDLTVDPVIDFIAPADGEYIVKLYDVLFRGGPSYFYRLSVSTAPQLDFVFPPSGLPGTRGRYTLYGRNLPGSAPVSEFKLGGKALEKLEATIQIPWEADHFSLPSRLSTSSASCFVDATYYRWETAVNASNLVLVSLAMAPVVVEKPENDLPANAQKVSAPVELVGQFYPAGDRDWFMFEGRKGDVFWLEVFSHRLGQRTDPHLFVQGFAWNDKKELKRTTLVENDDMGGNLGGTLFNTGTEDPVLKLSVGADGTFGVLVRDLYSNVVADPRHVYRLVIRQESPDFHLLALPRIEMKDIKVLSPPSTVLLRRGGTATVDVLAQRQHGFADNIWLSAENLPAGVRSDPVLIGRGQNRATLVLYADVTATGYEGALTIVGRARIGSTERVREARSGAIVSGPAAPYPAARARATRELPFVVLGDESFPITVGRGGDAGSSELQVARGGKILVPIKIDHRAGPKNPVTITPVNLPPHVEVKPLVLKDGALEGNLELPVKKEAPEGRFTFYLRCESNVHYRRNPAAAERALAWKTEMDKVVTELQAQQKIVTEANKQEIEKRLQEAVEEQKRAQSEVDATKKAAEPKGTDLAWGASPINLQIAATPFRVDTETGPFSVAAGAKLELPVRIARHAGFEGEVTVTLELPKELGGVKVEGLKFAKEQSEAKLVVEALADAPRGRHLVTLRAVTKFVGEDRSWTTPLVLSIVQ